MSVSIIGEKHDGGLSLKSGIWSGSTTYQLKATDPVNDRESQVYAAVGITEGQLHPDPVFAAIGVICRGLRHTRDGDKNLGSWKVIAEWSNGAESKQEKERRTIPNPLQRPPSIEGVVVREVVPALKDSEDEAYENTAGDPLDVTEEKERDQFRIVANFPRVPTFYRAMRRTVNDKDLFVGDPVWARFGKGCVRFIPGGFSAMREENGYEYVTVTFLLDVNVDGWDLELANKGYNRLELPDTKSSKVPYLVKGLPPSSPQWLDESGLESEDPYYITRKPYFEADYGDIQEVLDRI